MDFRNWDPGNQGVTGFSYGILHHHQVIEGSGIYYAIVRGDLRQAGKLGIEGSGILLGVSSPIYTREDSARPRGFNPEEDTRTARGLRRGTSPRAGAPKEAREEGEIQQQERARSSRREQEAPPMIPVQENLASSIILAEVQKVTSAPECEENGLDVVNELLGDENNDVENDVMELEEERVTGVGNDEGSGDGFKNLSDGEVEVHSDQATEGLNLAIGDVGNDLPEDKEPAVGEAEKKKVVHKGLFKSTVVAGGSTKAQMVQALIATRKRMVTKPATRHGEGAKQQEEKSSSKTNPNLRSFMEVQAMVELCTQGVLSGFFLFIWHNKL